MAETNTAKRLMARVKAIREALGLSQEAFAERADLKYKHYQAIEAGRKPKIQLPTLEKLAKACGLGLAELVDFETMPAVLAEDRAVEGAQPGPEKPARKAARRR